MRKLGLRTDPRRAMLRNMTTSLLKDERIETTLTRAKEVQRLADKMISLGKRGDLHAKRQALGYLLDESVVKKLFDQVAPRYQDRSGGYTRILKTGFRRGDSAPMVIIEFV
jgi:large subunit ribosomal protein L17